MLAIFEKIRRPADGAADLRQRHTEVAESLPQLEAEVRRHQQRRADGLLSLADREVERIESELALAVRNRDRALAALDELERRAADAAEAEARAALDAERAAAEARAANIARRLRGEYEKASGALVALLSELAAAEADVAAVNRKLWEASRSEEALSGAEQRAIPQATTGVTPSLLTITSLPPIGRAPGWGDAAQAAVIGGWKL